MYPYRFCPTWLIVLLAAAALTLATPLPAPEPGLLTSPTSLLLDICPALKVNCVLAKDWRNPIGTLGSKRELLIPFLHPPLFCDETRNSRECNRTFRECGGECEAYGPIPF
ncbi:hypothetical protein P7C73_g5388, partial [Tremellales sp. Uapishka_1]